jgi:hypothetical protein
MEANDRSLAAVSFLLGLLGAPMLAVGIFVAVAARADGDISLCFPAGLVFAASVASLLVGTFGTRDVVTRAGLLGSGLGLLLLLVGGFLLLASIEWD